MRKGEYMAVFETWLKSDLQKPVAVKLIPGVVFSQDNMANKVGVIVTDDGQPVTLSGTVYGYVIVPTGETIEVEGIIEENKAYFLMPQDCYVPGHISIVIKLTSGETITTLGACTAYVYKSKTDEEVVPSGTPIPDLSVLMEAIDDAMDQVAEVVESIPEDYTNLSNDVDNLKSALNLNINSSNASVIIEKSLSQGTIDSTGANKTSNVRIRTDGYIEMGNGLSITIPDGIIARACYYSEKSISGHTENDSTDYTGTVFLSPKAQFCRLVFLRSDGSNITPSAFTNSKFSGTVKATDETLTKKWKPADAAEVGKRIELAFSALNFGEFNPTDLGTSANPTGWRTGRYKTDGTTEDISTAIRVNGRIGFPGSTGQRAGGKGLKVVCPFGTIEIMKFRNNALVETVTSIDGVAYCLTTDGDLISVSIIGLTSPSSDYITNGDIDDIHIYVLYGDQKKAVSPGTEYFTVPINATWIDGNADSVRTVDVDCVVKFPATYSPGGKPTKLIFMHHGNSGTVNSEAETWYSESNVWINFVQGYLEAGYAVFDVNGCGPVSDEGASHDYGAFGALQAAYKAYKYIVDKYNVDSRIFVHGSSMGGATAYAFAKAYGGIIDAIGLFAPALLSRSAQMDSVYDYVAVNYGYNDVTSMEEDDYTHLLSANPHIDYYDTETGAKILKPYIYDWVNNHVSDGLNIVCRDFQIPVKIWCGTSDTSVDPHYGDALAEAISNGGGLAIFRPVENGTHSAGLGGNSTVIAEAVMWFDRFNA